MYTKYRIILLIFITVLLYPLNVYGMDGASYSNYDPGYGMDDASNSNYAPGYGMDGASNSNYDPGYGMDDASSSNYGNESKSEQKYVLFKGFVQIGETNRAAKENEVVTVIFCGEKGYTSGIFTDRYGKFEVAIKTSNVEALEKCKKNELNIGFYRKNPSESLNPLRNTLDGKDSNVQRLFAKVHSFNCLIFSEEFTKNDIEKLEEEREEEKKKNLSEYLYKQFKKQDDENSFQISFKSNYAAINNTEAELDDRKRYLSYSTNNYFFNSIEDSAKPETSSTKKLVKKISNTVTTLLGIKKEKPTHF